MSHLPAMYAFTPGAGARRRVMHLARYDRDGVVLGTWCGRPHSQTIDEPHGRPVCRRCRRRAFGNAGAITDPITRPGIYPNLPEELYHADPVLGGSLSSTGARHLLRSPALFRYRQTNREVKDAFDVGSAVHGQVLGTGWPVDVHSFDSWRSKAAQEARDESRALGRIPVLDRDYAPVLAMAAAILNHPVASRIFEDDGDAEVSAFAQDDATGAWLRARFDWLTPKRGVDVKTARSAEPERFARSAADYGYDVQQAFYLHVLAGATGHDDAEFAFVVVENEAPWLVSVIELDDEFAAIGRARMRRAIDLYAECKAAAEWPGYPEITHVIGAPRWLAYEEGLVI